jgi:hypothetical protein
MHTPNQYMDKKMLKCYRTKGYTHTHTEMTVNRPDIIIKAKKRENINTDRCDNTHGQICYANGSRKEN